MLFWTVSFIWCHWGIHWSLLLMTACQLPDISSVSSSFHFLPYPLPRPHICPVVSGQKRRISGPRVQRSFMVSGRSTGVVFLSCWLCPPSLIYLNGKGQSQAWQRKEPPLADYFWWNSQLLPLTVGECSNFSPLQLVLEHSSHQGEQ